MNDFFARCVSRFQVLEPELNALDASIGDGDHGATILKGLKAAETAENPVKAFRKAAGGASGSLFAQVISALVNANAGASLQSELATAASKISAVGQAGPGDKTMLDALLPAAEAETPEAAAKAAELGRDKTRDMPAKRGRARYVEGAGVGHVDPGATSVAELLKIYSDWKAE